MINRCRKKPGTLECIQWRGNNFQELEDWLGKSNIIGRDEPESLSKKAWAQVWVQPYKCWSPLGIDDWVIKGPDGLTVCENEDFNAQYEIAIFETVAPKETVLG